MDNTPWSAKPARGKPTKVGPSVPGIIEDKGPDEAGGDPDSLKDYSPSEGEPNGPRDPNEESKKVEAGQMDILVDENEEPLRPRRPEAGTSSMTGPSNKRPAEIPLAELRTVEIRMCQLWFVVMPPWLR